MNKVSLITAHFNYLLIARYAVLYHGLNNVTFIMRSNCTSMSSSILITVSFMSKKCSRPKYPILFPLSNKWDFHFYHFCTAKYEYVS